MEATQRRRRAGILARVISPTVVLALVAACGSQAMEVGMDGDAALDTDMGQPAASQVADEGADGGSGAGEDGGDPDDRTALLLEERIVKTGEMTLEVENVAATVTEVRTTVTSLGGYVGGSQAGTLDDRATLTVRVPADAFDTLLARLHELDATVVGEATREEVVTGQVVDLGARIDNLRASETSYRALLDRAEKIDDILAIQSRLDGVRGEIEQLTAQLEALEDRASLSTLTVELVPRAEPLVEQAEAWNPSAELDRAVASLVGIGQALLDAGIWFVVVWLPVLIVLGTLATVVVRGAIEMRRRLPGDGRAATSASDGPRP